MNAIDVHTADTLDAAIRSWGLGSLLAVRSRYAGTTWEEFKLKIVLADHATGFLLVHLDMGGRLHFRVRPWQPLFSAN